MNIAMQISPLLPARLPEGFTPVGETQVEMDGRPAILSRAERGDGTNRGPGGEHVSIVEGEDGTLLGFTRMTREMAQPAALPSENLARDVALCFVERHAPDLSDPHEIHWIAPHDETITVSSLGNAQTLTGMKVKMRSTKPDRLWFWVIVGPGEQVMVFERDIFWITMPGRRRTEQWLHDTWLAEKDRSEVKDMAKSKNR